MIQHQVANYRGDMIAIELQLIASSCINITSEGINRASPFPFMTARAGTFSRFPCPID